MPNGGTGTQDSQTKGRRTPCALRSVCRNALGVCPPGGHHKKRAFGVPVYRRQVVDLHHWCGARDHADVWFFNKPTKNDLHPTMKPVALIERALRNSSKRRDIVLDPFGGSGSTLIAAEKTGRQARLVERDPRYVDTIILRWQAFGGGSAVLDGDGRSYEDIATSREAA